MNLTSLITRYLEKSMVMQLASSGENIPWICTVCFAYDEKFTLYWFSRHSARHSQEILKNPRIAAAVSVPYTFGDKPIGLQFAGKAVELTNEKDMVAGLAVLQKRYNVADKRAKQLHKELLGGSADYGLYCLYPETIVVYDTHSFPDAPRKIYEIVTADMA